MVLHFMSFNAHWCGSCQTMHPVIEKLKAKYAGQLVFSDYDVDDHPQIPAAFKVRSIPTYMLVAEGKVLWKKAGLLTKEELEETIDFYLSRTR